MARFRGRNDQAALEPVKRVLPGGEARHLSRTQLSYNQETQRQNLLLEGARHSPLSPALCRPLISNIAQANNKTPWVQSPNLCVSNWGVILVTEMAVLPENKRNNENNRSSGINDGAQRTLATSLVVGT